MNWTINQTVDLSRGYTPVVWPNALMVSGDVGAHTWRLTVLDNGVPADLSGATITGNFLRDDGATVKVTGSVSGNIASVTLTDACYAVEGKLVGTMRAVISGATITLAAVVYTVKLLTSGDVVDPGVAYQDFTIDASPAGAYADLAALISDNPDHTKIYITLDDGKWCYYNGTTWIAGGVYQAASVAGKITTLENVSGINWYTGYINANGAILTTHETRRYSDLMCCVPGDTASYISETNHVNISGIAFYSKSGIFISGIANNGAKGTEQTAIVPENAYFCRLSTDEATLDKSYVRFSSGAIPSSLRLLYGHVDTSISQVSDALTDLSPFVMDFVSGKAHDDGAIRASSTDAVTSSAYPASEGDTVHIDDPAGNYRLLILKYNASMEYIGYVEGIGKKVVDHSGYMRIQIRRKDSAPLTTQWIADVLNKRGMVVVEQMGRLAPITRSGLTGQAPVYVSPDGDDNNNNGATASSPLKTIQAAISRGASTICLARGVYARQNISVSSPGRDLEIVATQEGSYTSPDRQRAVLYLGEDISFAGMTSHGAGVYSKAFSDAPASYQRVFVDKSEPPISTGSRPSPNAALWLSYSDTPKDKMLTPVLTLAACQSTPDSFFWDGSTVTTHIADTTGLTKLVAGGYSLQGVRIEYGGNITLRGIEVLYAEYQGFYVRKNSFIHLVDCVTRYSQKADGFSADYSDGRFDGCISTHNRNDGFNVHGYGRTDYYDCVGMYNGDDGISHHDGCSGVIIGGEWAHNGKGGVSSPTYGAQVDVYTAVCHHNAYGIYAVGDESSVARTVRMTGNVCYDNSTAGILVAYVAVLGYNNHFDNNTTPVSLGTGGVYTDLGATP